MTRARHAKGLFRATGRRPKPVSMDFDGEGESVEMVDALPREKDDFYPTPPEPTRAFLKAEIDRLKEFDRIWEPAAGDGAMLREFERAGLKYYASDLIDRGCEAEIKSFYDYKEPVLQAIVTNPPFIECNINNGWIRHALDVLNVEYMALLLPLNWIAGNQNTRTLWPEHTPVRIHAMRWRIKFTRDGNPPIYHAWFIWDRKAKGPTELRVIDRGDDVNQTALFLTKEAAE